MTPWEIVGTIVGALIVILILLLACVNFRESDDQIRQIVRDVAPRSDMAETDTAKGEEAN